MELDKDKLDGWITREPPENTCDECGQAEECTEDCRCENCREEAGSREEDARNDMD